VSSAEKEVTQLSEPIMFDSLKALDRKSFMNMHQKDNEKNLIQCKTEVIPEAKINEKENCGDDVEMKEETFENQIPKKSDQIGGIQIEQEFQKQVVENEVKVEEIVTVETLPEKEFTELTAPHIESEDVKDNYSCVKECQVDDKSTEESCDN
jgi:hypothetical protein